MSEDQTANPPPSDPTEALMVEMRQKATGLISKIDSRLLDQIHNLVAKRPAMVVTATVAAALADIICHLSKTQDGLDKNVLVVSEMILRIARAGLASTDTRSTITH